MLTASTFLRRQFRAVCLIRYSRTPMNHWSDPIS